VSKGEFSIRVELAGNTCPCAQAGAADRSRTIPAPPGPPAGPDSEDPRGFLSGRVAALIPLAPQAAMTATAQAVAAANGLTLIEVTPLPSSNDGLAVFGLPGGADPAAAAAALAGDPRVRLAEPDFIFETEGMPGQQNDMAELRYAARLIGVSQLDRTRTGKNVAVAIIDTGADGAHPGLAGRLKFKADVTATPYKAGIHGTLVAGIVAQMAPQASLLSIQACLPHSDQAIVARCSTVTLAKALDVSLRRKAAVINLSLGGPASKLVERLIRQAAANGVLVVAAAGNGGPGATAAFPASVDSVVAVTAVDVAQSLYPYATHGEFIDLAAPGVDILSAAPGGRWLVFSGTSAAAPHVSGVAALMLQRPHRLTPAAAQQLLETAARDLGPAGKDPAFGSGLVDAYRAVTGVPHPK
jgi:subtilisin family serine protease